MVSIRPRNRCVLNFCQSADSVNVVYTCILSKLNRLDRQYLGTISNRWIINNVEIRVTMS